MEKAQLVVTFDPNTGQINVTGPIGNEMLSLWMLEKARDSVKEFCKKQAERPSIVPVNGDVLQHLGRR